MLMKTWEAIINPTAGGGMAGKRWQSIVEQARASGLSIRPHLTKRPGHAVEIGESLRGQGHHHFISIGGDGTHHETINGAPQRC